MADTSKIEWTDSTFNPWIGCTKVSPACDHCYAEVSTPARALHVQWGPKAERRRTATSNWKLPLRWNREHDAFFAEHGRRRRVFCASLADVFDNQVPPEWRADLFDLIMATPNLDWLLLTKRIGNVANMVVGPGMPGTMPSNIWLGATICNQDEADRDIPKLLATPAAVRFLSMEPLLAPVDISRWLNPTGVHCIDVCSDTRYVLDSEVETVKVGGLSEPLCPKCGGVASWTGYDDGLDWVIVGGESGQNARPMHPDWARDLRDQCAAAGVPFLFKQWGEWKPLSEMTERESDQHYRSNRIAKEWEDQRIVDEFCGRTCDITDAIGYGGVRGFDKAYYVVNDRNGVQRSGMQVFNVGKKAAGRQLDGVQHDGYPEAHE